MHFQSVNRGVLQIHHVHPSRWLMSYIHQFFHPSQLHLSRMNFRFPAEPATLSLTDQFLWGSSFLVSPVLDQGTTSITAYFPDARWFSYYDVSVLGKYILNCRSSDLHRDPKNRHEVLRQPWLLHWTLSTYTSEEEAFFPLRSLPDRLCSGKN